MQTPSAKTATAMAVSIVCILFSVINSRISTRMYLQYIFAEGGQNQAGTANGTGYETIPIHLQRLLNNSTQVLAKVNASLPSTNLTLPVPSDLINHNHTGTLPVAEAEPTEAGEPAESAQDGSEEDKAGGCFQYNSEAWLQGPRFGNSPEVVSDDDGHSEEYLRRLILDSPNLLVGDAAGAWAGAMQPTICHPNSSLAVPKSSDSDDDPVINQYKRIYAAIHYHQHKHAIPEARARSSSSCSKADLRDKQINGFDYECPTAKHLIVHLGTPGLGANILRGVNVALILGMGNDRVASVMQNVPTTRASMIQKVSRRWPFAWPWDLASCPRRDWQCVFQPLSPCVVSKHDFENSYVMNQTENDYFRGKGSLPDYLNDTKVVLMQHKFTPLHKTPDVTKDALQRYAKLMDPAAPTIDLAPYMFPQSNFLCDRLTQVATIYSLRLLPRVHKVVREMVASVGTVIEKAVPSRTIGLPIRASDKCKTESQCLTYTEHLQAATDFWKKHGRNNNSTAGDGDINADEAPVSMIVTSESLQIREEHINFTSQKTPNPKFNYTFLTNSFEVPPGTGSNNAFNGKEDKLDADVAMIGSLSSLHLQMHANLIVANSCSNYHQLIHDFASAGCAGAGEPSKIFFLQESDNPWFRVCCWIKKGQGRGCSQAREGYRNQTLTDLVVNE